MEGWEAIMGMMGVMVDLRYSQSRSTPLKECVAMNELREEMNAARLVDVDVMLLLYNAIIRQFQFKSAHLSALPDYFL